METLRNPKSLIEFKAQRLAIKKAKEVEQKKQLKRVIYTMIFIATIILICNLLEIQ